MKISKTEKGAKIITTIFASRNKNADKEALRNLENDSQVGNRLI